MNNDNNVENKENIINEENIENKENIINEENIENKENIIKAENIDINDFINLDILKYTPKIINNSTITLNEKLNDNDKLELTDKDVYDILSDLYQYKFKMINYSKYNLEKEKIKIERVKPLIEKVMSSYKNKKMEIEQKDVELLYQLLENNEDNLNLYFDILTKVRDGSKEMIKDVYKINEKIFKFGLDYSLKHINNKLLNNIIMLSLTLFRMNNDKKVFLKEDILNHEIFQNTEFLVEWFFSIPHLPEKYRIYDKVEKNHRHLTATEIEKKELYPILISFLNTLFSIKIEESKIKDTFNTITNLFHYKEKEKDEIFTFIENALRKNKKK